MLVIKIILHRDLGIDAAILTVYYKYLTSMENSKHDNIKNNIAYNQTIDLPYKCPPTIHHNPTW